MPPTPTLVLPLVHRRNGARPEPLDLVWTQGVIDVVYASFGAVVGQGDGKVWHKFKPGGREEMIWSQGCEWTCQRLMEGAKFQHEVRSTRSTLRNT